ncbi:MAG: DUF2723 domain-containing protein [Candidatus Tectimicrobiota bacterium]
MSARRLGTSALFLLTTGLYLACTSSAMYWRDSPEFVVLAQTLGIGHPAGFPTYALLAKLATFLPLGSVAWRVNVSSVLAAALAVSLLFVLLYELLHAARLAVRLSAALTGALFLLVSESFWLFAVVAEVYALQNACLIALLLCLCKARQYAPLAPPAMRLYWLGALLYGLSAGVHATMAFFLPGFVVFLFWTARPLLCGKYLAFLTFFFLLGFAVYLYLPIRSLTNPAYDWGDPQTWQRLLNHMTDRKDTYWHTYISWARLPYLWRLYLLGLLNEFFPVGVALGLLGLGVSWRDRPLALLLLLVYLGNVLFFIRSWDVAWGFIPSFLVFAVWIGLGVQAVLTAIARVYQRYAPRLPQALLYALLGAGLLITLVGLGVRHSAVTYQSANVSAETYAQQLLAALPPDAIVFGEWAWFGLSHLQAVERQRPDVTVIPQGDILTPEHFTALSPERFPNVRLPLGLEGSPLPPLVSFWIFAQLNAEISPLFWDPAPLSHETLTAHTAPHGLLFAFDPRRPLELTPALVQQQYEQLVALVSRIMHGTRDREAREFLATRLALLGWHAQQRGFPEAALRLYHLGQEIEPRHVILRNNYGALLASQGHLRAAFEQYYAGYQTDPTMPDINKNLGALLLLARQDTEALTSLQRAVTFSKPSSTLYALLAEAHLRLQRFPEALQALEDAMSQFVQPPQPGALPGQGDPLRGAIQDWVQATLQQLRLGDTSRLTPMPLLRPQGWPGP